MDETPSGNIAASTFTGDKSLAQFHSRKDFCFKFFEAFFLLLSKGIDLIMSELDVLFYSLRDFGNESFLLVFS